jgi:hypothetical protein
MKKQNYIAWISPNHEHVSSMKVSEIEDINEFEWECERDGQQYNYGDTAAEAEKPLWELVGKADEIRKNFRR